MSPSASVVVCTAGRPEKLARCISSLNGLEHGDHEVIIVDNTTGDPEARLLSQNAGARYVLEPNAGFSRARNTGARAAEGLVVAFIDDDAVADPAWLGRHLEALEDSTLAATTGPVRAISIDSEAARSFEAMGGFDFFGAPRRRIDQTEPDWFEITNFGGMGLGSNMVIRRDLFESGWSFRESLGIGTGVDGEEHYAFFSIVRDGYAIAFVPDALVRHDFPNSMAEIAERKRRILEGNAAYVTMLLVEEPRFRRPTLRYVTQALLGVCRPWRAGPSDRRFALRREMLRAAGKGAFLYTRSRLRAGGRPGGRLSRE